MITEMREIALIHLNQILAQDNEKFYSLSELRQHHAAEILPLLVEDAGKVPRVYVLSRTTNQSVVQMKMVELDSKTGLSR